MKKLLPLLTLVLAIPTLTGTTCDRGTLVKELGTEFPAPISMTIDTEKQRAYVFNSNNNAEFTSTTFVVLDISDPVFPTILDLPPNPVPIPNFSGPSYLDATAGFVYTPNRASDNPDDLIDSLLRINIDETSADFGSIESFVSGENPFGMDCCDSQGRLYVVCSGGDDGGTVIAYNPADLSTFIQISLDITTIEGTNHSGRESTSGVLLEDRFFVSNRFGDIFVINASEVGDVSKNPLDLLLRGESNLDGDLRGITTNGTFLYVIDAEDDDVLNTPTVRVLDPSLIPAVTEDVPTIGEISLGTVLVTSIPVGDEPEQVLTFKDRAYVTNRNDDTVTVVNLSDNTVAATIPVGEEPFGLTAFTLNDIDYLYVTNLRSNSITIIDIASNTVVNTFQP